MKTETRVQQVRVLLNELKHNNRDHLPMILMGDFNEGPEGGVRQLINASSSSIKDSWNASEEGSFHGFTGHYEHHSRIDWILHSTELISSATELIKDSKNNIYPSDHFPVKTTLTL